MERVLIVAKTRMGKGVCLGGLTRTQNRGIRLLPPGRPNYPIDTRLDVGQVWDLEFHDIPEIDPPHVEDVIITREQFIRQIPDIREILLERIRPWRGGPEQLYEGLLTILNSKGYISACNPLPNASTGFWISDRPLVLNHSLDQMKPSYRVNVGNSSAGGTTFLNIPFVGFEEPIKQIPSGTLMRVSLARWFDQDGRTERRCYLQLSGWYV